MKCGFLCYFHTSALQVTILDCLIHSQNTAVSSWTERIAIAILMVSVIGVWMVACSCLDSVPNLSRCSSGWLTINEWCERSTNTPALAAGALSAELRLPTATLSIPLPALACTVQGITFCSVQHHLHKKVPFPRNDNWPVAKKLDQKCTGIQMHSIRLVMHWAKAVTSYVSRSEAPHKFISSRVQHWALNWLAVATTLISTNWVKFPSSCSTWMQLSSRSHLWPSWQGRVAPFVNPMPSKCHALGVSLTPRKSFSRSHAHSPISHAQCTCALANRHAHSSLTLYSTSTCAWVTQGISKSSIRCCTNIIYNWLNSELCTACSWTSSCTVGVDRVLNCLLPRLDQWG